MMRNRREKFSLEMKSGVQVATVDELRANFDLEKILIYLENGKLEKFLRDRFYTDEADVLQNLFAQDKNTPKKICEILGVNYEKFADTAEEIFWRRERLERLKKFTNDAAILKHVDDVAFDQDDLEDILSQKNIPATIYLCDKIFRFPSGILRIKNIRYIGIGKVTVVVESIKEIDFTALNISFENIELDKAYGYSAPTAAPSSFNETKSTVVKGSSGLIGKSALIFVNTARNFKSAIFIEAKNKMIEANSVLNINSLNLSSGERVTLTARGVDAKEAVDALIKLI